MRGHVPEDMSSQAQYLAVPAINFFGLPGYQQACATVNWSSWLVEADIACNARWHVKSQSAALQQH